MIRLDHVSKVYPRDGREVRALDDLSLDIADGEFVAVRGPSGSGKSTLLALVGGLATADSGQVFVAGEEVGAMSARQRAAFRAQRVGFVFQMFHLLPYLSVLDNVAVGSPSAGESAKRRALELLERFQMGHRLEHHPSELSAGERQRVAVARALMNDPPLLLADEPTGNLDPDTAAGVLELLAEHHRGGGTVVLVTHEQQAADCAERTIQLRDGRLATSGEDRTAADASAV